MDGANPKEKLLQASGVRQARLQVKSPDELMKEHLAQMDLVVKALMGDVKNALTEATKAHDRGEWMIEQLKLYCRDTLPKEMVKAIDEAAQKGVRVCLEPLETKVADAKRSVETLQRDVSEISGNWSFNLLLGGCAIAAVMSLAVFLMIRFMFIGNAVNEAKRYELWGRKVERLVESYPQKEKARIYHWIGGTP